MRSYTSTINITERDFLSRDLSSLAAILNTSVFQRLKKIRFLGAIDYIFHPNGSRKRHNRYDHTLGVAGLAIESLQYTNLNFREFKHVLAAALLHDIGHAPLSHSLESIFYKNFGLNHHVVTESIVRGEAPVGKDIKVILEADGLDVETILALIRGERGLPGSELFSSSFNIDTLDGITRTYAKYASEEYTTTPAEVVLQAALNRGKDAEKYLDNFWRLKDRMYNTLIQGTSGILADILSRALFSLSLTKEDKEAFFLSEDIFFKKYPLVLNGLMQSFRSVKSSHYIDLNALSFEQEYKKNFFHINNAYSGYESSLDSKRYVRVKRVEIFSPEEILSKGNLPPKKISQTHFNLEIDSNGKRIPETESVF